MKFKTSKIQLLKENVFDNSIPSATADVVISGFGLKTFNETQLKDFAIEVNRILKLKGRFSFIEISVPQHKILKGFFMFYIKRIIPILGKFFLGNPETYKMLGIYTEKFKNSKQVFEIFERENFEIEYVEYFFWMCNRNKRRKNQINSKLMLNWTEFYFVLFCFQSQLFYSF